MILTIIFLTVVPFFLIKYLNFLYKVYKLKIPSPSKGYPVIGHALWVIGLNEEGEFLSKIRKLFDWFKK